MQDEQESCQKFALKIVLIFLYLARIGRPDILGTVNKLVRATTKKTRACDKRLARLISCTHHTSTFRQCCHVGSNTVNPRHEDFFHVFSNLMELQEANVSVKQHRRSGIGFFGRSLRILWYPSIGFNGIWSLMCTAKSVQIHSLDACHSTHSRCAQHISSVGTSHWLKVQKVRVTHIAPHSSCLVVSLLNVPYRPFPRMLSSPSAQSSRLSASTTSIARSRCNKQPTCTRSLWGVWPNGRFRSEHRS